MTILSRRSQKINFTLLDITFYSIESDIAEKVLKKCLFLSLKQQAGAYTPPQSHHCSLINRAIEGYKSPSSWEVLKNG